MSVCLDTSFDFSRRSLLVGILIFRRSEYIRALHESLCRRLSLEYIHVRELSKKKKLKLLSALNEILREINPYIIARFIELRMPKGTNRFRKYAFLERAILAILRAHKETIRRVILPSDLNVGNYSFLEAIEKRIEDPRVQFIQEDSAPCVQLADALLFLFRRTQRLPIEFSYTTHNC